MEPPTILKPGESRAIPIRSAEPWNPTGILVEAGGNYDFEVKGDQHWWDFFVRTTADGYASFLFLKKLEDRRRIPTENWFKLIGVVGPDITKPEVTTPHVVIGQRPPRWTAPVGGPLYAFANDLASFYFNNFGTVWLTVTRI